MQANWRHRKRGIVLLMSLVLMVVVALIGRALVVLGPTSLALSGSQVGLSEARQAADSGIEYVAARLREDPEWKADEGVVIDTPSLFVLEDRGNVIGFATTPTGQKNQFRVRFNYQDGSGGPDGLDDPLNVVDHLYISVNNLSETTEAVVPRAAKGGDWAVEDPAVGYRVPGRSACIIVEGRSGRGLKSLSLSSPNAAPVGPVDTYVAEAFLKVTSSKSLGDASLMGAGDINVKVKDGGEMELKAAGKKSVPRLRSKMGVTVQEETGDPGTFKTKKGRVGLNLEASSLNADFNVNQVTLDQEKRGDGTDFFNLKWNDVKKADKSANSKEAVQIPAGVYVNWGKDGSVLPAVHYYDMTFEDYKTHITANPSDLGTVLDDQLSQVRKDDTSVAKDFQVEQSVDQDGNRYTDWNIKSDLAILPSANTSEFTLIPRMGGAFSSTDTDHTLPLPTGASTKHDAFRVRFRPTSSVVSFPGDSLLMSRLLAENATITSDGSLHLNTSDSKVKNSDGGEADEDDDNDAADDSEQAEADAAETSEDGESGDSGESGNSSSSHRALTVNLYVKDEIVVSTYLQRTNKYYPMNWTGLVYTWDNFTAQVGEPSVGWGAFVMRGALVAYGSDPETGTPGIDGLGAMTDRGQINIDAKRVELVWDKDKLSDLLDLGALSFNLERTVYHSY